MHHSITHERKPGLNRIPFLRVHLISFLSKAH